MAILAIEQNGDYIELPTPARDGFSSITHELVRMERNTLGNARKYRVAVKADIPTCAWVAITPEQKNLILSLTDRNTFNVRYFDCVTSTIKYGLFYRKDDLQIKPYPPFKNGEFRYYDVSFSLGEI